MAAPAYVWEHNADIGGGDRVPTIVTMEATAIETKVGTFLCTDGSGRVALGTDGNTSLALGLAVTATTAAYTAGDPIKVALFFPGEVIKGKASSDASTYSGFISKAYDLDADGRLDPSDTTGGGLSIWRTEDAGLTVYCVVTNGAIIG